MEFWGKQYEKGSTLEKEDFTYSISRTRTGSAFCLSLSEL
jgi:hypothetical protein